MRASRRVRQGPGLVVRDVRFLLPICLGGLKGAKVQQPISKVFLFCKTPPDQSWVAEDGTIPKLGSDHPLPTERAFT